MPESEELLLKRARTLELECLETNRFALGRASELDRLLNEVFVSLSPKPIDYDNRRDLIRIFNLIAKEVYGNCHDSPVVEVYGSFVMDMFSVGSDLDLSINFSSSAVELPRQTKIQTLSKFAKKLYSIQRGGHVIGVQSITSARVPIVKVIDRGTLIECDLSVENRDGVLKSQIIRLVSGIDERFRKLSFLMKVWAKSHDINSSKYRTLNSLSITSLVAFHLQTRDPPILPPFSALFKDGNNPADVAKMVQNYLNYGKRNKESLAELFVTLLIKLASVEKLWQKGLCPSLCKGSWISKAWNPRTYSILVEDFTDPSQNISRAVGTQGKRKIYRCISSSLSNLGAFSDGRMQGTELKELLFGRDTGLSIVDRVTANGDKRSRELVVDSDSDHIKKKRLAEDLEAEDISKVKRPIHHGSQQSEKKQLTEGTERSQVAQWEGKELANGQGESHVAGEKGKMMVDINAL